jgi:phosphoribosyl-ATP pyrophosphohydrolase
MKRVYNKLVRDNIPEIIRSDGGSPVIRILKQKEFKKELLKKVVEESKEVLAASGSRKELVKEFADLVEICNAAMAAHGIKWAEVEKMKEERQKKRGGFEKRIFLKSVK